MSDIFKTINQELEARGLFGNVFTFIDASAIVSKTTLWEERDKAIKDGKKNLTTLMLKSMRLIKSPLGSKKQEQGLWFGFKRH